MVGTKAGADRPERGKSGREGTAAPSGSLRERRDREAKRRRGEQEAEPEKPKKGWKHQVATLVPLVLVVVLAGFVGFSDGGPEAEGPGASPEMASWAIISDHPDGSQEVLCDSQGECSVDALWPAVEAGADCRFTGRMWLETTDNPVFLRGLRVDTLNTTTIAGNPDYNGTQDYNFTMDFSDTDVADEAGVWWRAFSKHVDVEAPVPCDPVSVTLRVSLSAKTLFGGEWSTVQTLSHLVHEDISGIAGAGALGGADPADKGTSQDR